MRDELSLNMLPIVEEEMNDIDFNPTLRFISSNGYYGYQYHTPNQQEKPSGDITLNDVPISMEVQLDDNYSKTDEKKKMQEHYKILQYRNRKRAWEYGYCNEPPDFKKRRQTQDDPTPLISEPNVPAPLKTTSNFRHPTHNMPDMPRCMMGHYI